MSELFIKKPPHTKQDLIDMDREHGEFFGICWFCGSIGHIDRLVEVGDYWDCTACDECIEKHEL